MRKDEIKIYDNTNIFKLVVCIEQGELIWKEDVLPEWTKSIINYNI